MAFQDGPMMSMDLYRKMIKPHHRRLFGYIQVALERQDRVPHLRLGRAPDPRPDRDGRRRAQTPSRCQAKGMDSKALKREFGKELCFWGAIDTQRALPFGGPEDVRAEVRRRIEDLAPGGGYVLCAVHNIQADVTPENICAMYDAAQEFRTVLRGRRGDQEIGGGGKWRWPPRRLTVHPAVGV